MIEKWSAPNWNIQHASINDIDRIVDFNTQIFRPPVGIWAQDILTKSHPMVTQDDFIIIEERSSGTIAASLALIRQTWLFEGIPLQVGQVELVGTSSQYRGHGLMRMGMEWFEKRAREKGCLLGCVQGIPTLYQKFGYHFAADLKGGVRIGIDQVPSAIANHQIEVIPLTENAYAEAVTLHNAMLNFLTVRSEMTLPLWQYQEQQSTRSEHAYETFGLSAAGCLVGYLRFLRFSRLNTLILRECGFATYSALVQGLIWSIELARDRNFPSLVLQMPKKHPIVTVAETWGAQVIPPYAWQVRVFDWKKFFEVIAPILERRIAISVLHDLTMELIIYLVDENTNWCLQFANGRLSSVEQIQSPSIWHLKLDYSLLTALVMGYRSRLDLEQSHLEMQSEPSARYVVDILFPQSELFIYETY